jgi:probable H4MPT-linked C1 transfer pathway protein
LTIRKIITKTRKNENTKQILFVVSFFRVFVINLEGIRTPVKRVLGLDIGGANLKMAHTDGTARTVPFELWKQPKKLPTALRALVTSASAFDEIAVTMTGESCDCFETKREGVHAILDAVRKVTGRYHTRIWSTAGHFVYLDMARDTPLQVASANWLALATFAGRYAPEGPAMLVDIGSTTADLIPLLDGIPKPQARADADRLKSGELAYKGARRTPVCAIYGWGRVAAEFFATIHDIYLVMGLVPEDPQDCRTADGRPTTRPYAHARLARMLGGDAETIVLKDVEEFAWLAEVNYCIQIACAMFDQGPVLPAPPRKFVLAGSGEFVGQRVVKRFAYMVQHPLRVSHWPAQTLKPRLVSLSRKLGEDLSTAACAYAVAVLAAERDDGQ